MFIVSLPTKTTTIFIAKYCNYNVKRFNLNIIGAWMTHTKTKTNHFCAAAAAVCPVAAVHHRNAWLASSSLHVASPYSSFVCARKYDNKFVTDTVIHPYIHTTHIHKCTDERHDSFPFAIADHFPNLWSEMEWNVIAKTSSSVTEPWLIVGRSGSCSGSRARREL